MKNDILTELLGNYTASFYVANFIFVLLGVLISVRIGARKRDKNSPRTPYQFSWRFLLQDNVIRIISSMAVVFVAIRLGSEIFNTEPTYFGSVIMGLSFDKILEQIEKLQSNARKN